MAHYAFIDQDNVVTEVIVGIDETELIDGVDPETWYGNFRGQVCKRTSYNTYIDSFGVSQHLYGGIPFRGKYAGIGDTYDAVRDVFVGQEQQMFPVKPYESWIFNEVNHCWEAPFPFPPDGKNYIWNEEIQNWIEFKSGESV